MDSSRIFFVRAQAYIRSMIATYYTGEHNIHTRRTASFVLFVFVIFVVLFQAAVLPPRNFPIGVVVQVQQGSTLIDISDVLKKRGIIRFPELFTAIVIARGGERRVLSGDYYFATPLSSIEVARRLTLGEYGFTPVRVTFPEGITLPEISEVLLSKIPGFSDKQFLEQAAGLEGYLFPDTYFFLPNVTSEAVIQEMRKNFDRRTENILQEAAAKKKTTSDVIIMASIVEREGITFVDKKIIAGILWKRISIGMPLQVDAPFVYAIGRGSIDLTRKDLRTDSAYNTYTRVGLPEGPIANPGLDSIIAAVSPTETKYLFYLSDRLSRMHYAENFEGHKKNREKYLGQ